MQQEPDSQTVISDFSIMNSDSFLSADNPTSSEKTIAVESTPAVIVSSVDNSTVNIHDVFATDPFADNEISDEIKPSLQQTANIEHEQNHSAPASRDMTNQCPERTFGFF